MLVLKLFLYIIKLLTELVIGRLVLFQVILHKIRWRWKHHGMAIGSIMVILCIPLIGDVLYFPPDKFLLIYLVQVNPMDSFPSNEGDHVGVVRITLKSHVLVELVFQSHPSIVKELKGVEVLSRVYFKKLTIVTELSIISRYIVIIQWVGLSSTNDKPQFFLQDCW